MATRGPEPLPYTIVAGEDLSAHQFAPLAYSGGKVQRFQACGDQFIGVLAGDSKPKINEHAGIVMGPAVTKVRVGGAVTQGNYLTVQSGWFYVGAKALWSGSSLTSIGSRAINLAGFALETVASGGICTAKIFETLLTINSGTA